MVSPIYTYKGFRLYKIRDGLYSVDQRTVTYAYLEKAPETHGGGYVALTPDVQSGYAELSQRLARGEYADKSLRYAFRNWVNKNHGTEYAYKYAYPHTP